LSPSRCWKGRDWRPSTAQLAEDGSLSGVFTQSGVEGSFVLDPGRGDRPTIHAPPTAGVSDLYTDPAGRFSAPIPTNWTVTEGDGYVLFADPERAIEMYHRRGCG
jgi:hypothetical protein